MGTGLFGVRRSLSGGVPSGTVMLFYQETVPVGWTRVTTGAIDKHALVVDTQTALGSFTGTKGGANEFATALNGTVASGSHAGSAPAHVHSLPIDTPGAGINISFTNVANGDAGFPNTGSTNPGGASHAHAMDVDIAYVNLFLARKN